jgi:hypothetical protein
VKVATRATQNEAILFIGEALLFIADQAPKSKFNDLSDSYVYAGSLAVWVKEFTLGEITQLAGKDWVAIEVRTEKRWGNDMTPGDRTSRLGSPSPHALSQRLLEYIRSWKFAQGCSGLSN